MRLQLTLARVASRTCFAGLPPHVSEALLDQHADALGAGGALEVSWQQSGSVRSALMTWAGGSSASQSCLELSNAMCDAMGLVEGTELTVTLRKQLPVVSRIFVEPLCSDDWEIMQLHAGLLEEQVLNQVRAVSDGMTLPLWISASSMVRLKVKSLHVGDSSVSAGLLAQNSEVVVAPLERKVVGVAQFDDDCQMLRVLALEHLLASRSPADRNAEDNGMLPTFGEVMLPSEEARGRCARVGSDGEAESAAHRRDGQEIETGRCGDGDSQKHVARDRPRKFRAGLHLFRGVDGDGAVVPISSGDESAAGGEGRGAMGRRVRMAVSRARPDAIVPRQHVLLSRVMRLQLDAAIGSWIAVSRLRVATARGGDKAGTPGVTGNADGENISESEEEEAVLTPAKICIQRVLLTGATASESGDGGERARLGSSPEQQDNSSRQDKQDGGQVRGRAPLKELLLKWLAVNAPVKKRRLCVSDSVLLALPHDAQYAAGDAEIDGSACSKNSTLACLSFRQGNDHVYAAGSSVCYFGLWLQGVTEAVVEEGADVVWGEWTEHVSLSPKLSDVESLGEVTSRVISHLRVSLLSERRRAKLIGSSFGAPGSLLIYGSPGCGKTLLCRALAHMVSAEWARKCGGVDEAVGRVGGGRCYAEVVACREMGRSGEQRAVAVMSKLEAAFKRARRRSPALLVLDDIDVVAPAISSQGQGEVGADASARIRAQGQLLIDMMRELGASKKRVAVVATAKTLASVNVATLAGGLFDAQIEIPAPDRHARVAILRRMLQAAPVASSPLLDVSVLIHELDGFTPHDLNILTIRAAAAAAARALESPSDSTSPINMTEADLKSARQGFVPPALRGAQARENVPWESVAGMNAAKDTLLQLVLLPTKYPDIFATAPLRVRSGALLLGYPGCGKTMLVAALATKTGLNFISVKGPELLNKYIGQSEQGVRDVFMRASAARPCILFFDEFDSIAPQRGHDSTGVTDRVVNQFLTALDGVEGLTGVFVVAATSRPEMIDAALLRPGRLDAHILCDMPDTADRRAILEACMAKMQTGPDVDVASAAQRLDGFSAADLQALVYNAQLLAVHDALDRSKAAMVDDDRAGAVNSGKAAAVGEGDGKRECPIVTAAHFERAIADVRPSLTAPERRRYEKTFSDFMKSHSNSPEAAIKKGIDDTSRLKPSKSTLA